ncbi:MAG TPA: dihydroxyacetone kinase phosphoryl donor subunit DhaM [Herpetosiphonaceae bacterium]
MVGLLIVSHSARIATGVKELADQMTQAQVLIAVAGGTIDGRIGTSADLIRDAAEQLRAAGVDGVLVLVDLGSAVMSAEMALEGFERPYHLSSAPLVEGAVLAAVEASIGGSLARAAEVAEQAGELPKVQS